MLFKTKGIVLRSVKYGETSLVVTVFTELFGVQSYIVNNVRTSSSKGTAKAIYFQPSALLDLVVYHNQFKNLQRIKEAKWAVLYQHVLSDVIKNTVAQFIIELLTKCLKEPEAHTELFHFSEDVLLHLDRASASVTANIPIFFAVHLAVFFGFGISDEYNKEQQYLDLQEGIFTSRQPQHAHYMEGREAEAISDMLKARQPDDLSQIRLNQEQRRHMLSSLEIYYALHIAEFGNLRTLPVLREIS